MPTRIFIDRDNVQRVKLAAREGRELRLPLFKIRRATGLTRAHGFVIRDAQGNEVARGGIDPTGRVCGATAWVEVPDGVEVELT